MKCKMIPPIYPTNKPRESLRIISNMKAIKTKTKPKVVSKLKVTEEPVVYSKDITLNKKFKICS